MAISGLAVGLATAGGVLLVAGLTNRSAIDTLKDVLGQPQTGKPLGPNFSEIQSGISPRRSIGPLAGGGVGAAIGGALGGAGGGGAASGLGAALVAACRSQIGKRYVWATQGPDTFDCSGLIIWALRKTLPAPVNVPRFTTYTFGHWAASQGWKRVGPSEFRSGDVIVKAGHMGIAVSADRMINAANPWTGVVEEAIWAPKTAWWGWRPPGGS